MVRRDFSVVDTFTRRSASTNENPRRNRKNVEVDFKKRPFPLGERPFWQQKSEEREKLRKMNVAFMENVKTRKNLHRRIHALSEENLQSLVHDLSELEKGEAHEQKTVAAIKESLDPENRIECRDIQGMFKK